jgi:hypothetical protein
VLGLQNRRVQLQLAMEEQRHEVEGQRNLLRAELKAVTGDMHKTVLEKKERVIKVVKVRAQETEGLGGESDFRIEGAMRDRHKLVVERQKKGIKHG